MNILVTGGTGYIGSHTCVALLEAGHSVIIVDNLYNSDLHTVDKIEELTGKKVYFHENDLTDIEAVYRIFNSYKIDGVIHFAGLKAVGESIQKPLLYYYTNILSTLNLLNACQTFNVNRFVFSSSATVYGDNKSPFTETMNLLPTTNPYGQSKVICERILEDIANVNPKLEISILRYFNPVGAHESGLIGESPKGIPNNLMPYITQVAKGRINKLSIFGNDYPTVDGTGVRDYIHVQDIAEGHVAALENHKLGIHIYNLGSGKGTSVLELLVSFEEATGIQIPYEIVSRRPGDNAVAYANVEKVKNELGWIAKRNIVDMCRDAWNYERNNYSVFEVKP